MVGTISLGQPTTEGESDLEATWNDEPVSDAEAFLEVWNVLGEAMLANADPEELSEFLQAAEAGVTIAVELTAYLDADDVEGVSLYDEFDFEPDAECEEDPEEAIDDQESCECGDSDETD